MSQPNADGRGKGGAKRSTGRRKQKRKMPYLAKRSLEFSVDVVELTSELKGKETTFDRVLEIFRTAAGQQEAELGYCRHKHLLHKLVFKVLLREFSALPEDDKGLEATCLAYASLVVEFNLVQDLVEELKQATARGADEERDGQDGVLRRVFSHLARVDQEFWGQVQTGLKRKTGFGTGSCNKPGREQGPHPCNQKRTPKKLHLLRASERALLSLEDWPEYLTRQAAFKRTDASNFLNYFDAFQIAVAEATAKGSGPTEGIAELVLRVLRAAMTLLRSLEDAMKVVDALLLTQRFVYFRNSLGSLFSKSFVESSIVSISNKTAKNDESFVLVLREILLCLLIDPKKTIEKLLRGGLCHSSQVAIVVDVFVGLPILVKLKDGEPGASCYTLEILASFFAEFLGGTTRCMNEERNLLGLINGLTGHREPGTLAGSPIEAAEVLHVFLVARGDKEVAEASSFRILQHLLECTVGGGSAKCSNGDVLAVMNIVDKYWEGRDLSKEDSPRLGFYLETAEVVSRISSMCEDCLSTAGGSEVILKEKLRSLVEESGGVVNDAKKRGMLSRMTFLDSECSSQVPTTSIGLVESLCSLVLQPAEDPIAMIKQMLSIDCVASDRSLGAARRLTIWHMSTRNPPSVCGIIERLWWEMCANLKEWINRSPLRALKCALLDVIARVLPWCTRGETKHFCCFLFPVTILHRLGENVMCSEEYLLSSLQVLGATERAEMKVLFTEDLTDAKEIASGILKLDLIESIAKGVRALGSVYGEEHDARIPGQALHQLSIALCMACVESLKWMNSSWTKALSLHCFRVLCDTVSRLGRDKIDCLNNLVLEMTHIIFDPEFRSAYACKSPFWVECEAVVEKMFVDSGADPTALAEKLCAVRSPAARQTHLSRLVQVLSSGLKGSPLEDAIRSAMLAQDANEDEDEDETFHEEEPGSKAEAGNASLPGLRYTKSFMLGVLDKLLQDHPKLPVPDGCTLPF
ncbi:hypothetical protein A3770_02p18600 [Chloropicon primus]|uniref:Uncharacterized protein n=3 Tax=Chloropicon primus TaxID=1764295 RepID=A0A5B8MJ17_9CHLO|nr:hypothetical protein A3770_02p18600 [Chloropicon primus]|eukprot:QDZ19342.1 hypothetical protein A3770_02p18600 [Chloropicon primus]